MGNLHRRRLLAVSASLTALLVTACTPGAESASADEGQAPPQVDETPHVTESQLSDASDSNNTEEEWVTWEAFMLNYAASLGIENPPPIEIIRVVEPEETFDLIEACLDAAGFVAQSPGFRMLPEEQLPALTLARWECTARYPFDEAHLQPETESLILFIRQHWAEVVTPCLAEQGIQLAPVPTEDTFLATWATAEMQDPSGQLFAMGFNRNEVEDLLQICPELPTGPELLYHR